MGRGKSYRKYLTHIELYNIMKSEKGVKDKVYLPDMLSEKFNIPKEDTEKFFADVFSALAAGYYNKVEIPVLGSIRRDRMSERKIRHPKSGDILEGKARPTLRLKINAMLKEWFLANPES